jgi:hypothetical protein
VQHNKTIRNPMRPALIGFLALLGSWAPCSALAQVGAGAASGPASISVDPWPRQANLGIGTATLYQPQVESWDGNRLQFRAVVAVTPAGGGPDEVGVMWASAITHVDRVSRLVVLDDVRVSRAAFPALAGGGAATLDALRAHVENAPQTIALDRLKASLAVSHEIKPDAVVVRNAPPRVFVSFSPAILIPISGEPVLRPVTGTPFERVINTRALILRDSRGYYLRLYDGWMTSESIDGNWQPVDRVPQGIDRVAETLAGGGQVDLLDGGTTYPRPSLRQGAPTVYTSFTPAELVVFAGEPALEPIPGTGLLWAGNTRANVIVEIVSGQYYVLLSGRWFRSPGLKGPWTFVGANALPADFSKIPPDEPAGAVLASVAGTPQAADALIENAIPQTATVPRINGPTFRSEIEGHPQFRPITGTALHYVANSPTPIIRVNARSYFALQAGIWFEADSVVGPWSVAGSVPAAIDEIPPGSPLHYVSYVRVFSATPQVVEVGYTPGYTGTVVTPEGVVAYGTGFVYQPWIGDRFFPAPITYGTAAQPYYHAAAGMALGFVMGAATPAMLAPAYYGPAYSPGPYYVRSACCYAPAIQNVYGHWGTTVYTGLRVYSASAVIASPGPRVVSKSASRAQRWGRQVPDGGSAATEPRPVPAESFTAAAMPNDRYADPGGNVYRSTDRGWEKRVGGGWVGVNAEDMSWASREAEARTSGAERFKDYREAGAADRLTTDRFGTGDRVGTADRFGEGGVRVGGLRGRRGEP